METVLANSLAKSKTCPVVAERNSLRLFILKLATMAGWLVIGGFLAWLVQDFGQTSGLGRESIASLLILFMFVMSSLLISMISWNSYRTSTGRLSW